MIVLMFIKGRKGPFFISPMSTSDDQFIYYSSESEGCFSRTVGERGDNLEPQGLSG